MGAMSLDIRTLVVAHALIAVALASLMVVFWLGHRRMPGLALWALSAVLFGVAAPAGALRNLIPDSLSIVVVQALAVVGLAAIWNGIRLFDGRPARWSGGLLTAAGNAGFVAYHTYVVDDVLARMVVASFVLSACCGRCAYELIRGPARTLRGTAAPAAALFGLVALTLAVRAVSTALFPPAPDVFAPTAAQGVHYLVSIVGHILIVVALLMMAAQRLQRQLEDRNAELEAARSRAEAASRAKSEFLATVSHELRTPLNAVIGFSDVQRREIYGPLGHPRYREYAEDIHASGAHLLDLITTILDISKAEAKKLQVEPVWLDPRPVLETTVRLVREAADAKRLRLSTEIPATPLRCFADPQALKQILLNLLSNAVKFTPEGGAVTLRFDTLADHRIEIIVRDTGIGIAAADLPRLMKPFEQANHGYARQNGGTGLGLPLVDSLVRLHGGELHIESAPGQGTAVIVRLPCPEVSDVAAA
jgi:signal transduction histidine kinase